jgi:hypothetical protein
VLSIAGRRAALPLASLIAVVAAACSSAPTPTPPPASTPSVTSATSSTAPASAPEVSTSEASGSGLSVEPSPVPSVNVGPGVSIDPANFVAVVDNPWYPLKPGTTFTYKGTKDGGKAIDTFSVMSETRIVAGVTCVVVHDELTLDGTIAERTDDWYVQDRQGNVWYFGEATAELDDAGKVTSTEGSWEAGVDGAQPGIFMPADPKVGDSGVQELYPGQAEDHFVVLLTNAHAKVPAGSFSGVLLTAEWTPLEPDVLSEKAYVMGMGEVREADVAGGDEKLELTKITP